MTSASRYLPLTRQDGGYLERESDRQPMHFVLGLVVDPAADGRSLSVEAARDHVAQRVEAVPQLRRRVARTPGGVGPPVWVDDPDLDVARHVRRIDADLASVEDVDRLLAAESLQRLPLDAPLWRMGICAPLPGGQVVVTLSVHHAAMDGGLLVTFLRDVLGDALPQGRAALGSPPSRLRLLAFGAAAAARRRVAALRGGAPAPAVAVLADSDGPDPGLSGDVSGERLVRSTAVPLQWLRAPRRATGATVNDAFLAAVAGGVRDLLVSRGADTDQPLLALVPRDVRSQDEADVTGNRTWTLHVPLRVEVADPVDRLRATRADTERAKQSQRSAGNAGFRFDIAVSNVALGGPFSLAGCPVRSCRGTAPLQGRNRVLVLGFSYLDEFTISWTGDGAALADLPTAVEGALRSVRRVADVAD